LYILHSTNWRYKLLSTQKEPKESPESLAQKYSDILIQRIKDNFYGRTAAIESMSELAELFGGKKNKAAVSDAIAITHARGYLRKVGVHKRYRVLYPTFEIPGLTANFTAYLNELGYKTTQSDLLKPQIITVSPVLAAMYPDVLTVGDQVVERKRLQGILDPEINLRIGGIFYPEAIARPFMDQLLNDTNFDMLVALKEVGIVLTHEKFSIFGRVPEDRQERDLLRIGNLHPLLEVRRIGYAEDGTVITFHRTIMNANHFRYDFERDVPYFK